jgi:hypothetical protein
LSSFSAEPESSIHQVPTLAGTTQQRFNYEKQGCPAHPVRRAELRKGREEVKRRQMKYSAGMDTVRIRDSYLQPIECNQFILLPIGALVAVSGVASKEAHGKCVCSGHQTK